MYDAHLTRLAELPRKRNTIDEEIAAIKWCLKREGPIDTSDPGARRDSGRPARSNFLTAALREHS